MPCRRLSRRSAYPTRISLCAALNALVIGMLLVAPGSAPAAPPFAIQILSSSPDQVSGGDALARVQFPGVELLEQATLLLNGVDVTDALALVPEGDALQGVITGFALGENLLQLTPNPKALACLIPLLPNDSA